MQVKSGYARNFLLPQGKALSATEDNMKLFETRRVELERQQTDILSLAQRRAEEFATLDLKIERRASEEGRIFGSVSANDIVSACAEAGAELQRAEVRLSDGPLRELGEHVVTLNFHPEVEASVKVEILTL